MFDPDSKNQYDKLIQAISKFPLGASLEEISNAQENSLPKRTL